MSSELSILIADASVGKISLIDLLRRAKIFAKKTGDKDFLQWVDKELEGYENKKAPDYRKVKGQIKALNPVMGWVPVQLSEKMDKLLTNIAIKHPVSHLEELLEDKSGHYTIPLTGDALKNFQSSVGLETRFEFHFQRSELKTIVERIRNRLLDSLLEKEIRGNSEESSSGQRVTLLNEKINAALLEIGSNLPEMRSGMWEALKSNDPAAARNATNLARELIDQVLKEGAPDNENRKKRAEHLIKKYTGLDASEVDLDIIKASADLIVAEQNKTIKTAHSRNSVSIKEARSSVLSAERILEILFGSD